ncbi:MAG: carbohydrate binding family 9 domain-containing protein, partial [Bacteroidota bacterium]
MERPTYETVRIEGASPIIDGKLDDASWDQVEWSTGFHQREPNDSAPASQQTQFKILYDNRYLYVGWRCFDTDPDSIEARLSRRDNFPGDWVEINFDSFNDKRTGFSFTTSASGVKGDEFISQDGNNWDDSWNPSWLTRTNIDSLGWTAECRIPFSQLRFGNEDEQTWGIQSTRRLFRYDEFDTWAPLKQA